MLFLCVNNYYRRIQSKEKTKKPNLNAPKEKCAKKKRNTIVSAILRRNQKKNQKEYVVAFCCFCRKMANYLIFCFRFNFYNILFVRLQFKEVLSAYGLKHITYKIKNKIIDKRDSKYFVFIWLLDFSLISIVYTFLR